MRLVFAGTPEFARRALDALVAAGHEVSLVLTRVDKPAQRGHKLVASPVKQWAQAHGIEVWQPRTLREPDAWERLRAAGADAMVVAAYGMLLPPQVLEIPRLGCLNIHASLLPRWRGAAPIQRAVQAGDPTTGITIMQMDEGLDTGAIRLVRALSIDPGESAGSVHDRLAVLGAEAIVEALERLATGDLPIVAQPPEGITYAAKITKADAVVDWTEPPRRIVDRLRAFDPAPGCVTELERAPGAPLKLWRAREASLPAGPAAEPGTVLAVADGAVMVACGSGQQAGAIELLELQRPGGRRMAVRDFLAGFPLRVGDRLRPPGTAP